MPDASPEWQGGPLGSTPSPAAYQLCVLGQITPSPSPGVHTYEIQRLEEVIEAFQEASNSSKGGVS